MAQPHAPAPTQEGLIHEPASEHGGGFPPFESSTFVAQILWLALAFGLLYYLMSKVALPQIAVISRLTRAGMIEVLSAGYIRTARAKGLPERRIVLRHALTAALLPLVSYLGPACAGLLTGSLVVERIFNLPGLGKFFVVSALQRDYTVVMGMVIVYAALILVLNLAADLLYAALDPRVRLG